MVSMQKQNEFPVSLPIVMSKEGRWFVASCPILDIATQGKTEKEVKENMKDLIGEYFEDPDTRKPSLKEILSSSVSLVSMPVKLGVLHGKASLSKSG
ncbi:MAG: type II toxin-antitoxin system HicB family antitoxin [Candidatus Diapherotrites archaeon]